MLDERADSEYAYRLFIFLIISQLKYQKIKPHCITNQKPEERVQINNQKERRLL